MPSKKGVTIKQIENRRALLIRLILALVFVYVFGSLAIDSGSYWHYIFTFVSLGISVNAAGRLVKDIIHRNGKRTSSQG